MALGKLLHFKLMNVLTFIFQFRVGFTRTIAVYWLTIRCVKIPSVFFDDGYGNFFLQLFVIYLRGSDNFAGNLRRVD